MKKVAIIVKREVSSKDPETDQIEKLANSAGYSVKEVLTQNRPEHHEYNIGEGKVHESNIIAQEHNADAIIVDNVLDPYQMYNYGIYVPKDVAVLDRYKLVLDIFERQAQTKKSQLQVEMAQLRYELPRAETKVKLSMREERPGFMGLGEYEEEEEKAIKNRINRIKSELDKIESKNDDRRNKRRQSGFDLVSIAGYTNAGKSTLLRRLSDSHTVDENKDLHNDIAPTAKSSDNYFTTLDTTTRKMLFNKRDVLLTDTVGFIDNIPEWLIEAFKTTYDSIYASDLILLVVDATDDVEVMRRRLATSHNIISRQKSSRIITVFNKIDGISKTELARKQEDLEALAPNPICVSSVDGTNINQLKETIHRSLPPFEKDTLLLPLRDESMSIVSWVYDNAYVNNCEYTDTNVIIEYEGRKNTIEKAKYKARKIYD